MMPCPHRDLGQRTVGWWVFKRPEFFCLDCRAVLPFVQYWSLVLLRHAVLMIELGKLAHEDMRGAGEYEAEEWV